MVWRHTSLVDRLGASPRPGELRALLDSVRDDHEAFSAVAYEAAQRWPRVALAVLLPRADDATLDRLLESERFGFEKQTPIPSKLKFVTESLEVRAAPDGTELIAHRPPPEDLIDTVLRAAGPAIVRIEIGDEAMDAWSRPAWAGLDRGALREATLWGANSAAISSLLSGAIHMTSLRAEHATLADDSVPPSLHRLDLARRGPVRTSLLQALADCPRLARLTVDGEIDADGMTALAAVPALTELYAWGSKCGDAGARAIAAAPRIAELAMTSAEIGDDGAEALATMRGVSRLWLSHNRIGARGAAAISRMTGLDDLSLDSNLLDDAGVRALASLRGLSKLTVKDNPFTDPATALDALRDVATAVDVEDDPYAFFGGI